MKIFGLNLLGAAINATLPQTGPVQGAGDGTLSINGTLLGYYVGGSFVNAVDLTPNLPLFPFETHRFTNAGASGRVGPTLAQMKSAYAAQSWAQDSNFLASFGSGFQVFTVPRDGLYRFEVRGATRAGITSPGLSNLHKMFLDVRLQRGWKLYIGVGQSGSAALIQSPQQFSSSGGGGTFVYCPELDADFPILVSGGSGGCTSLTGVNAFAPIGTQGSLPKAGTWANTSNQVIASPTEPGNSAGNRVNSNIQATGGGGGFNAPARTNEDSTGVGNGFLIDGALNASSLLGGTLSGQSNVAVGGFGGGGASASSSTTYRSAGGGGGFTGGWYSYQTTAQHANAATGGNFYSALGTNFSSTQEAVGVVSHGYCVVTFVSE